ncbi:hypothetical protein NC651_026272 [Populus alba x Populus x berolinensis]|nr:hypothetical protein NC651_026272 [Populus alba x Populus x berolinensis]
MAAPPHQQQHCTSSDFLTDRPPTAAAKVVLPSYSSIRVSSSHEQQHQLAPAVAQSPAPQRTSSLNSSVSRQLLIPPPASYQPQACNGSNGNEASDEETEPDGLGYAIERGLHICCKFVNQNALDVMSALWKLYPKRLEFQGKQLFCSLGDWKKDGRYHVEAWS